jgi:hypothetical protein
LTEDPNPKCDDNEWIEDNCVQHSLRQTIIVCYFALTTLSTVGYGDYFPITKIEKVMGMVFMLIGIVFFSKIMNSFIQIVQNYELKMNQDDAENNSDLNSWLQLLTRFQNKPLPKQLQMQIDKQFSYFWANNRLGPLSYKDEFLN